MKELNDFETQNTRDIHVVMDERSGFPKFIGSILKAKRCIKCNKIAFAHYKFSDYECMRCR